MISYFILIFIKIIDSILNTAKSIATYKEQKILSSILVVASQLIFYLIIDQVISDNTLLAIVIVAVSSGVGNYIALHLNEKLKRDTKWTYVITSKNIEDIKNLCNYLAENKIRYTASKGYTKKWEETINVKAFSKSKHDSRLIESFLKNTGNKYLKEVI